MDDLKSNLNLPSGGTILPKKWMVPDELRPLEQELLVLVYEGPDKSGKYHWFRYDKRSYHIGRCEEYDPKGEIITGQIFHADLTEHIQKARRFYRNVYVRDVYGVTVMFPQTVEEE